MTSSSHQRATDTWPTAVAQGPAMVSARFVTGATALAPVAWGTTYITITELLPDGRPIFIAAMRLLPAGLVLLGVGRLRSGWRPPGTGWCRTALLAVTNFGIFFPLLVIAISRLPGGVAASGGGLQPLFVAAASWAATGRRPRRTDLVVGAAAAIGVALIVLRGDADLDRLGLVAMTGANASFALGIVLTKAFPSPTNQLAATGWQSIASGTFLLGLAVFVEGTPPVPDARTLIGFAYLSLVATAGAFVLWFDGIRRLPTPTPPLLGLIAPALGAALGWLLLGESLSVVQLLGFIIVGAAIAYGALLGSTDRAVDAPHLRQRPDGGIRAQSGLR